MNTSMVMAPRTAEPPQAEPNLQIVAGSAPLRNAWYVAAASAALKPGKLVAKTILGEPVLLGRDRVGQAFAFADFCPHRGTPLRFGRFDGAEIECYYHGWRFDSAGTCTLIPTLVAAQQGEIAKVHLRRYPLAEVQGHAWIFMGENQDLAAPIPVLPELDGAAPRLTQVMRFDSDVDNAVVGLMDPAHGPFVHRSWYWRSGTDMRDKTKHFEPSPWGFTMQRHSPTNTRAYWALGGKPEIEIAFHLPSMRWEHIKVGRHVMCHLTALTPIDDTATEITHSVYWTQPWLDYIKPLLRPFATAFLAQDRDAITRQKLGLIHNPPLLLLGDPDALAKWYVRLKNEYVRAEAENRAFVNPLKPRTLQWRT